MSASSAAYGRQDDQSDKAPSSDEYRSTRKLENANNAVSGVKANADQLPPPLPM